MRSRNAPGFVRVVGPEPRPTSSASGPARRVVPRLRVPNSSQRTAYMGLVAVLRSHARRIGVRVMPTNNDSNDRQSNHAGGTGQDAHDARDGRDARNSHESRDSLSGSARSGGARSESRRSGRESSSGRGFAAMDPAQQRRIASEGGRAAHQSGHAHEFDSREAREAGRKGGEAVSRNREHMSAIGRRGAEVRNQERGSGRSASSGNAGGSVSGSASSGREGNR